MDNLGGILSVVLVGTFVLAINFLPVAGYQQFAVGLLVITVIATGVVRLPAATRQESVV